MAKKSVQKPESNVMTIDEVEAQVKSLDSTAYAMVRTGKDEYKVLKFNFDLKSLTMGEPEVIYRDNNKIDAGNNLILILEDEIFL